MSCWKCEGHMGNIELYEKSRCIIVTHDIVATFIVLCNICTIGNDGFNKGG